MKVKLSFAQEKYLEVANVRPDGRVRFHGGKHLTLAHWATTMRALELYGFVVKHKQDGYVITEAGREKVREKNLGRRTT